MPVHETQSLVSNHWVFSYQIITWAGGLPAAGSICETAFLQLR